MKRRSFHFPVALLLSLSLLVATASAGGDAGNVTSTWPRDGFARHVAAVQNERQMQLGPTQFLAPVTAWESVMNSSNVQHFTNTFVAQSLGVLVKWVTTNGAGSARSDSLQGINISSGRTIWNTPIVCAGQGPGGGKAYPSFVLEAAMPSSRALVGCSNDVLVIDVAAGQLTHSVPLPADTFPSLLQGALAGTAKYAIVSPTSDYLLIECRRMSTTPYTFGVLALNLATYLFTSSVLMDCAGPTVVPAQLIFVPERAQVVLSCTDDSVRAFSVAATVLAPPYPIVWSFQFGSGTNRTVGMVAVQRSGSVATSGIAVVSSSPGGGAALAFLQYSHSPGASNATSLNWSSTVPGGLSSTLDIQASTSTIFLLQSTALSAFAVSGSLQWQVTTHQAMMPPLVLDYSTADSMIGVFGNEGSYLKMLSAATGAVLWVQEVSEGDLLDGVSVAFGSMYRSVVELDSTVPTVGYRTPCVFVCNLADQELFAFEVVTGQLLFTFPLLSFSLSQAMTPSLIHVPRLFPEAPLSSPLFKEAALVMVGSAEVLCLSLSAGWTQEGVQTASFANGVFFAAARSQQLLSAIDRVGTTQWTLSSSSIDLDVLPVPFGPRYVLQMNEATEIIVADAYSGAPLTIIQIPDACLSSTVRPSPFIESIAVNKAGTDGFFTAQMPCLFHVDAAMNVGHIPATVELSEIPVVDDGNSNVYVNAGFDVVAFNKVSANGSNYSYAWSFHSSQLIDQIVPSFVFTEDTSNSRFIFTTTAGSVMCLDGLTGSLLWEAAVNYPQSLSMYNNSVFVVSYSGLCKLQLDPLVPTPDRQLWCVAPSASALLGVTPLGVAVVVTETGAVGIDTDNGVALWSRALQRVDCSSAAMDTERGIMGIVCGASYFVALNIASGTILFSASFSLYVGSNGVVNYFENMFVVTANYLTMGAVPLPTWLLSHRSVAPADTAPPIPQTVAPGFEPKTMAPQLPPPFTQSPARTAPISIFHSLVSPDYVSQVLSVASVSSLVPGVVFTANEQFVDAISGDVYVASSVRLTKSFVLQYEGQRNLMASCVATVYPFSIDSFAVGTGSTNYTWVTVCGNTAFGEVFGGEVAKWTSNMTIAAPFSGPKSKLAVPALVVGALNKAAGQPAAVKAVNAFNGEQVWATTARVVTEASQFSVFYPPSATLPGTYGIAVLSGTGGIEGFNITSASTDSTHLFALNGTAVCDFNTGTGPMLAARDDDQQSSWQVFGSTTLYFGCVGTGGTGIYVYSANVVTGEVQLIHHVQQQSTSLLNLVLLPETETLLVLTPSKLYSVSIAQETVEWESSPPSGTAFAPALGSTSSLVFTLYADDNYPAVLAWSRANGQRLWNVSSGSYVSSFSPASRRISTYEFLGPSGVDDYVAVMTPFAAVAASTTSGDLLWSLDLLYQPANGAECASAAILPTVPNDFTVGSDAAKGLLLLSRGMCTGIAPPAQVVLAPYLQSGAPSFAARITSADIPTSGPFVTPSGELRALIVLPSNANTGSGVVLANINASGLPSWQLLLSGDIVLVETAVVHYNGATVPISALFTSSSVTVIHTDHSLMLAYFEFNSLCPAHSADALYSSLKTAGRFILFADSACFYRIDIVAKNISAVILSPSQDLSIGLPVLLSSDEQVAVLVDSHGTVYGVLLNSMSALWSTNFIRDYSGGNADILLILPCSSNRSAHRSVEYLQEQFIVFADVAQAIFSLSFGTGQLLWFEEGPQELFTGEPIVAVTSDGALVLSLGSALAKLTLAVDYTQRNLSRILWTLPVPIDLEAIMVVPDTDLIVAAFGSSISAILGKNGSVVWTSPNVLIDETFFVSADSRLLVGNGLVPPNDAGTLIAYSLATGVEVFSIPVLAVEAELTTSTTTICATSGSYMFMIPLLSSAAVAPPVPYPPPTPYEPSAPPAYHFTTPQPRAMLVNTSGLVDFSEAAILWETNSAWDASYVGAFVATDTLGRSVLVAGYSNSSGPNQLVVLSADNGTVLFSRELGSGQCGSNPIGSLLQFLKVNDDYGLYSCGVDVTLFRINNDPNFSDASTTPIVGGSSFSTVAVLPASSLLCFTTYGAVPPNAATLNCITLSAAPAQAFATIVCNQTFSEVAMGPVADDVRNLIYVSCACSAQGVGGATVAVHAATGSIAWQNPILKALNQVPNAYTADFGVSVLPSGLSSSIQLFDLQTGSTQGTPFPVGPSSIISLSAVQTSESFVIAVVNTENAVLAVQLPNKILLWTANQSSPAFVTTVVSQSKPVVVVRVPSDEGASFTFLDLTTGHAVSPVYANYDGAEDGIVTSFTANGSLLVFTTGQSIVFFNVTTLTPYTQLDNVYANSVLTPFAITDSLLGTSLLCGWETGVMTRVYISPGTLEAAGRALTVFSDAPLADVSNGFLAVSAADITAVLYNTDTLERAWSVSFQSEDKWTSDIYTFNFPPQIFASSAPSVAIVPLGGRHFAVVELNQGLQLADGFLPLCQGLGWSERGFAVARDELNGVLYVTMGNPCLYGIRATTGSVFLIENPRSAAFQRTPIVTPECIVAIDEFGTIMCFPRTGSTSPAPLPQQQPLWQYRTGYSSRISSQAWQIPLDQGVFGDYLLIGQASNLLCLSLNQSGQLFWTIDVGERIRFVSFNDFVYVVSSRGLTKISMNVSFSYEQRVVWQIPHSVLSGTDGFSGTSVAPPLVTASGVLVFSSGLRLIGMNCSARGHGTLAFNISVEDIPDALIQFSGPAARADPVLRNVFFASGLLLRLHDANTGAVLMTFPQSSSFTPQLGTSSVSYMTTDGVVVSPLPLAYLAAKLAPASLPEPILPPPNATLPAGFVPQGRFAGLPTVPPGVQLPDFGCVLNVEALYPELVSCVNAAVTAIYEQNSDWSSVNCASAAGLVNVCVLQWVGGTDPTCLGATLYLNQVLGQLNASAAFNFCWQQERCSSPSEGQQVCDVVQTAQRLAPGQTLYPAFTFPAPADQLPDFTLPPSHSPAPASLTTSLPTAGPTTMLPSLAPGQPHSSTTVAPTTQMPTTQMPTTQMSTTAAPASTASPDTTVPTDVFQYLCSVVPGTPVPPKALALEIQSLLELPTLPAVTAYVVGSSQSIRSTVSSTFVFFFADVAQAPSLCAALDAMLDNTPALVAVRLQLSSISRQPFVPPPTPAPLSGPTESLTGVIIGSVGAAAVAVGLIVYYLYHRHRRAGVGLHQSDLLESGGLQGGRRQGATRESRSGLEMAPILPGREKEKESGGYTQL